MPFLEIRNLSKKYNSQIVLSNISFSLPSKGLFCIVGKSGEGKSTLINCICGIEKMDEGEVFFQNKKIKNFEEFRNKYIGMIYQNSNLVSFLNIKDNLFLKANKKNDFKEFKIEKFIDNNIKVISGGEAQRVALLRTTISNSKIIFADEPTGSLDKDNAYKVMDMLKEKSKDNLVIIVSHNIELMKKYKPIFIKLEKGKISNFNYKTDNNNCILSEKPHYLSMLKSIKIAFNTLFNNLTKMIISLLSLSLAFSFFLISHSSAICVNKSLEDNKTKYLDYTLLKIVKEKSHKIDNSSLTLVKEEKLLKEDIVELNYLLDVEQYHYDLTPLFSSYPLINHPVNSDYYLSNIEWVPYFKKQEEKFLETIEGRFPKNPNEVVINEACKKYFSNSRFNINIENKIDLKLPNNEIITDQYCIDMNFNIVGMVDEFDLLMTPKIYYPYDFYLKLTKEINLPNLSSYYQLPITLYDRLTTITGIEDNYISNKLILEVDEKEVEEIYTRINSIEKEDERLKVYSMNIEKVSIFKEVFASIYIVLEIFVGITLLISLCLLILVVLSFVLEYKKDIGIMLGLGILKSDITSIFLIQSFFLLFVSILFSLLFYRLFMVSINNYLYTLTGIKILSPNISIQSMVLLILLTILIGTVVSFVITRKITKMKVASILKED